MRGTLARRCNWFWGPASSARAGQQGHPAERGRVSRDTAAPAGRPGLPSRVQSYSNGCLQPALRVQISVLKTPRAPCSGTATATNSFHLNKESAVADGRSRQTSCELSRHWSVLYQSAEPAIWNPGTRPTGPVAARKCELAKAQCVLSSNWVYGSPRRSWRRTVAIRSSLEQAFGSLPAGSFTAIGSPGSVPNVSVRELAACGPSSRRQGPNWHAGGSQLRIACSEHVRIYPRQA